MEIVHVHVDKKLNVSTMNFQWMTKDDRLLQCTILSFPTKLLCLVRFGIKFVTTKKCNLKCWDNFLFFLQFISHLFPPISTTKTIFISYTSQDVHQKYVFLVNLCHVDYYSLKTFYSSLGTNS